MRYKLKSWKEYNTLEKIMTSLNVSFCSNWKGDIKTFPYAEYDKENNRVLGHVYNNNKMLDTLGDFIAYVTNISINKPVQLKYKLTDNYEALYEQNSDIVKVGCQNIYVNDIRALLQQIDILNSES